MLVPDVAQQRDDAGQMHRPIVPGAAVPACNSFGSAGTAIPLEEALRRGLDACGRCFPDGHGEAGP